MSDYRECHEGVTRRGEYQPCEKVAVALRYDQGEDSSPYPVCAYHARGDMAPLARVLADAKAEALREFARKWAEWVAAGAPQIRGGASYRAICEAQEIERAEASGQEDER